MFPGLMVERFLLPALPLSGQLGGLCVDSGLLPAQRDSHTKESLGTWYTGALGWLHN